VTAGPARRRSEGETTLLDEILSALENGREPDLAALEASHPGRAATIDRLLRAARRYFSSLRSVGGEGPAVPSLRPGDRLGDFEIVDLLGRGGEGEVYRARQLSLGGRAVALKTLVPFARSDGARSRFEREAMILADLHHPHLAEVHGFGEARGLLFLAMRLVEGISLRGLQQRLRERRKGPPDRRTRRALVDWISEVSEALALVHQRGVVHRDVKPSNIILEDPGERDGVLPSGSAVLVDFGLARRVAGPAITRTGHGAATPEYASPEQLVGADVDARADVFALGATLHDLLTGRIPGERPQASAGLEPLESLLDDVDRDLFAVVRKAVELDPRRRYSHAGDFLADLRAWREGREVDARRQRTSERVVRWIRTHPRRLLRVAAATAGAALLAIGLQGYGRYAAAARDAEAAYAAAEPVEFVRSAGGIPALLRPLLLRDRDLRRSFERMTTPRPGEPRYLADVASALEEDDFEGALLAAATEIRVLGSGADPLAEHFLLSSLRGGGSPSDPSTGSARKSAAIRVTARLFYEAPAADAIRLAEVGPFRDAILDVLQEGPLTREDRLYAMTALSGCGIAEDVGWLFDEALAQSGSTEEERLGLVCTERILLRAHRMGHLDRIDLPDLCERFAPYVREWWGDRWWWGVATPGTDFMVGVSVGLLASTLAIVTSSTGRDVPWTSLIPAAADRFALEDGCSAVVEVRGCVYTLSRLEDLVSRLRSKSPWTGFLTRPYWVGLICGFEGDGDLDRHVRKRLAEPGPPFFGYEYQTPVRLFEEGLGHGYALRGGENPPYLLDADTLLGATPNEDAVETVLWSLPEDSEPEPGPWALWDFTKDSPRGEGAARRAVLRYGDRRHWAGRQNLRLGRFGDSELRLRFTIASPHANRVWYFDLDQQPAYRVYYPFAGEVFLEIRLDGKLLDSRFRISAGESPQRQWHLPSDLMTPGNHEISVRMEASTTTTYGIERARLRVGG